tara:strand:+ start:271 stop:507 length:237 start_codon:yes stop_codon:yes gene_type:complete
MGVIARETKMRLISIENMAGPSPVILNVEQISSVYFEGKNVIVRMSDGLGVKTKFTDVGHAVDYIQRASSYSFVTSGV